MKSGIYTTELWVTLISLGLAVLVTHGILNQEEADSWKELLIALLPLAVPAVVYVWSRTRLKQGSQ